MMDIQFLFYSGAPFGFTKTLSLTLHPHISAFPGYKEQISMESLLIRMMLFLLLSALKSHRFWKKK